MCVCPSAATFLIQVKFLSFKSKRRLLCFLKEHFTKKWSPRCRFWRWFCCICDTAPVYTTSSIKIFKVLNSHQLWVNPPLAPINSAHTLTPSAFMWSCCSHTSSSGRRRLGSRHQSEFCVRALHGPRCREMQRDGRSREETLCWRCPVGQRGRIEVRGHMDVWWTSFLSLLVRLRLFV